MGANTLSDLSNGRFVLGLGTSSPTIVERWMGTSFDRPLPRLREYVHVLRSLLAGEKVRYAGETVRVDGLRLAPPAAPIPIFLAALGPAACRLAGEVADGVIFFLKTPEAVAESLRWVVEGAYRAGRDSAAVECAVQVPVALEGDEDANLKRFLVSYALAPVYARSLARQGFGAEVEEIAAAWNAGDRPAAVNAVSEGMLHALIPRDGQGWQRIASAYRAAGATTICWLPVPPAVTEGAAERLTAFIRACAPGVP
jgi:alkanesulfonate monooxygenase SsuD/methylene tetrahydromethanopterin reductase-like flavin-dependent oxidoreductase (luciferase family)